MRKRRYYKNRKRENKNATSKNQSPLAYRPVLSIFPTVPLIPSIARIPEEKEYKRVYEIKIIDKPEFVEESMKNNRKILFSKGLYYTFGAAENKEPRKFKSFLCDHELFNWGYAGSTRNNIRYFASGDYTVYISYLCNKFPQYINFYGRTISETQYKEVNTPFAMTNSTFSFNNLDKYEHYPITVVQNKDTTLNFYYTDQIIYTIQSAETYMRYLLTTILLYYVNTHSSHFTVLLIDRDLKVIDYYDPHGRRVEPSRAVYIHQCLKILFPDYTINEHWKNQGIQIDKIEQFKSPGIGDDIGFCTVWGTLMIHLKLLNMNMSFKDIEDAFISECYNKKLSLYEVMLNYANLMMRIIPKNPKKYDDFSYILSKDVRFEYSETGELLGY